MKQYNSGLNGEQQAEEYLCGLGMQVLERRYRGGDGEIDLIMLDQAYIVFVEVKARPGSRIGSGIRAVTTDKQRRMSHAAMAFLVERQRLDCPVRFDVVELTQDGILHIPNAFLAQDTYY